MNWHEFHLEQYREVRAEALKRVDETRTVERYALLGLGGYYAFLFKYWDEITPYQDVVWWIPVGLAVCGGLRSWALFSAIKNNAEYLRKLEKLVLGEWVEGQSGETDPRGWEQFLLNEIKPRRKWALKSSLVFWPLLIGGSILIACVLSFPDGSGTPKPREKAASTEATQAADTVSAAN